MDFLKKNQLIAEILTHLWVLNHKFGNFSTYSDFCKDFIVSLQQEKITKNQLIFAFFYNNSYYKYIDLFKIEQNTARKNYVFIAIMDALIPVYLLETGIYHELRSKKTAKKNNKVSIDIFFNWYFSKNNKDKKIYLKMGFDLIDLEGKEALVDVLRAELPATKSPVGLISIKKSDILKKNKNIAGSIIKIALEIQGANGLLFDINELKDNEKLDFRAYFNDIKGLKDKESIIDTLISKIIKGRAENDHT